ncbi:MAG: hypothetical protein KUG81_00360 [Gammaproteobacteria bacterium]|nr:hypothetical protein [Gammaproteobacteria bacterium]
MESENQQNAPQESVKPSESTRKTSITQQLTAKELEQVRLLKNLDREVRSHEQAHAIVGGPYAGAPNYQYTKGPDGQLYASSGHVKINSSEIAGDPAATLEKALQLKRAALAPAQPSQQDRRVAANAQQLAIEARADLNALLLEGLATAATAPDSATIDTFV